MIATDRPTMTHGLTDSERNALVKAIKLNGAALVTRLEHGIYSVPSHTQPGVEYLVCGVRLDGSDLTCTCEAGQRGIPCWHKSSVRLRRVQEDARRQARKLSQRTAPPLMPPPPARQSLRRVELL